MRDMQALIERSQTRARHMLATNSYGDAVLAPPGANAAAAAAAAAAADFPRLLHAASSAGEMPNGFASFVEPLSTAAVTATGMQS